MYMSTFYNKNIIWTILKIISNIVFDFYGRIILIFCGHMDSEDRVFSCEENFFIRHENVPEYLTILMTK